MPLGIGSPGTFGIHPGGLALGIGATGAVPIVAVSTPGHSPYRSAQVLPLPPAMGGARLPSPFPRPPHPSTPGLVRLQSGPQSSPALLHMSARSNFVPMKVLHGSTPALGLLGRIDGVVGAMERDLTQDLETCIDGPLRNGNYAFGAPPSSVSHRGHGGGVGDKDTALDWLDRQIWAIQNRKEACDTRRAHLADLRHIVAEDDPELEDRSEASVNGELDFRSGHESRNGTTLLGDSAADASHSLDPSRGDPLERRQSATSGGPVDPLQNARRELEPCVAVGLNESASHRSMSAPKQTGMPRQSEAHQGVAHQDREIMRGTQYLEASRGKKAHSRLTAHEADHHELVQAVQALKQAEALAADYSGLHEEAVREAQHLREKLYDCEKAKAALEEDLHRLAECSNCRLLQARIGELESDQTQAHSRMHKLEEQRQTGVDEIHDVTRAKKAVELERDAVSERYYKETNTAKSEIAQMRQHEERLQKELDDERRDHNSLRVHNDEHRGSLNARQKRIEALEEELDEEKHTATQKEAQTRKQLAHSSDERICELEKELHDERRKAQRHVEKTQELEQQLENGHPEVMEAKRQLAEATQQMQAKEDQHNLKEEQWQQEKQDLLRVGHIEGRKTEGSIGGSPVSFRDGSSILSPAGEQSRESAFRRASLQAQAMAQTQSTELLMQSKDPFSEKVRLAVMKFQSAFQESSEAHVLSVQAQVEAVIQAQQGSGMS